MNATSSTLALLTETPSAKAFRKIIGRVGRYNLKQSETGAGLILEAIPEAGSHLPKIRLILNFVGEMLTARFQAKGNLNHYVIEELMLTAFDSLFPFEIELAELESDRVQVQLDRRKISPKRLYQSFKKQFFSYYASEPARLLILFDQDVEVESSISLAPNLSAIKPKVLKYTPSHPLSMVESGRESILSQPSSADVEPQESTDNQDDLEKLEVADSLEVSMIVEGVESEDEVQTDPGIPVGHTSVRLEAENQLQEISALGGEDIQADSSPVTSLGSDHDIVELNNSQNKTEKKVKSKLKTKKTIVVHAAKVSESDGISESSGILPMPESVEQIEGMAELSEKEKSILSLIDSKANRKVQSKGLKKEVNMDQGVLKDVLRSLVRKSYLYVEAAWYLRKSPGTEINRRSSSMSLDDRLSLVSPKERKIFDMINTREGHKAQARMLVRPTKMSKENLKKVLREMVAKDVLFVEAAWYVVKN